MFLTLVHVEHMHVHALCSCSLLLVLQLQLRHGQNLRYTIAIYTSCPQTPDV